MRRIFVPQQEELSVQTEQTPVSAPARRSWEAPRVTTLPALTELTLQTVGIPGGDAAFTYFVVEEL